jgi:hypothetical protein
VVYAALSEALEEREELVGRLVAARPSFGRDTTIEGSLRYLHWIYISSDAE